MKQRTNRWLRALRAMGLALEWLSRVAASLLLLAVLILLVMWLWPAEKPRVEEGTALVLAPTGDLVEQLQGYASERAVVDLLMGREPRAETLMRTMLEAIERATTDERVQVLVLDLNRMGGAGLTKLQDLGSKIEAFRAAGKRVVAHADTYFQPDYYLAAMADEVFLHPMGLVLTPGYGSYRNYYKEALEKLAVNWHVFRVGEYKSAVEPYLRNEMSPEAREARSRWLGALWESYKSDVGKARGLEPGDVEKYAAEFHLLLRDQGGSAAELARDFGLVDRLAYRDEVRARLIELVGEDEGGESFKRIGFRSYLKAIGPKEEESDNVIGVVVAKGVILDGSQPPGAIGGDSTAELIRQAREDEDVKAVVLRVDSPGGSSFASEVIRREVELTLEAGKPVVASFGSVAASGGYWISMSVDEIWASPVTITGSIGIYATFPTVQGALEKFGVHNDGVGTTKLAGTVRLDRDLPPAAAEAIQLVTDSGYRRFIQGVAAGRGMSLEEVEEIARGRVWIGADGHRLGLVDRLGDLEGAVIAAATRAEVQGSYKVRYIEASRPWRERVFAQFLARMPGWVGRSLRTALRQLVGESLKGLVQEKSGLPPLQNEPFAASAYCDCGTF